MNKGDKGENHRKGNICRANREIIQRLRENFKKNHNLSKEEKEALKKIEDEVMDLFCENKRIDAELRYVNWLFGMTDKRRRKSTDFKDEKGYLDRYRNEIEIFQTGEKRRRLLYLNKFVYDDNADKVPDVVDYELTNRYKKLLEKCKIFHKKIDKNKKRDFAPILEILKILIYKTYRIGKKIEDYYKKGNKRHG